jgi:HK97 family phage major capsid protein
MADSKLTAKALREQRADLILKAQSFASEREDEQGLLAAEDQGTFDEMVSQALALDEPIRQRESRERVQQLSVDLTKQTGATIVPDASATIRDNAISTGEKNLISVRCGYDDKGRPAYTAVPAGTKHGNAVYRDTFSKFLSTGKWRPGEYAALQSDDAEQAGYLVASEQFASELLKSVDDAVHIRRMAKIHTVREATSLGIRARTAKLASFAWSSELAVSTADSSLKYGKRVLTPHHLSGQILVSRDLLRRSVVSVESEVRSELSRNGGEVMEQAYLTGSGAQQPLGVFTASTDGISTGRDVTTGSATGFTADKIKTAYYTLKQQYRPGGSRFGARWMFHRDGILKIAQLKDGNGQYLLQPGRGLTEESVDMLLGLPVDESEFAPNTFTAGLYVGLLANWQYYEIADSLDLEIQVLFELDATTNQVRYIARLKTDGMPTLEEAFVRLRTD